MDRTCYLWLVDPKKRARANTAVSLLCTMGKVVNLKYQGPNPILGVPLQVAWWHDLPLYHWLPRLPAPLRQRLAVDVCEHILLREKHEDLHYLTMVFPNFLCKRILRPLRVKSFWVAVANIFQDCREALKQHRSKEWCPYTRLSLLQREDHKPTCFFSRHFSDKPDCTKKRSAKIERSEKTESDAAVFCCVFHSAQLAPNRLWHCSVATWASCAVNVQQSQLTNVVLRDDGNQQSSFEGKVAEHGRAHPSLLTKNIYNRST